MRLVTRVKLNPTREEHAAILATLLACNKVANDLSTYAYETNTKRKFDLHYAQYNHHKTILGSQALVRTIAKVADAYTTQKGLIKSGVLKGKRKEKTVAKPIQFREDAAQAFDKNNLSYNLEKKPYQFTQCGDA